MAMKKFTPVALTLFFTMLAFSATLCRAEENSPSESAQELMEPALGELPRAPWEASIDGMWRPKSDSSDAGGKVGMSEEKARLGRTFRVTPRLSLTPEIIYSEIQVSAPSAARLPEALHSLSLGLRGDYQASRALSFSMLLAPGLEGDFRQINSDDIRVRVGFTGRYQLSDKLTLLGGLIYQEGYHRLPVLPIIGAIYRPDEKWTISLAAPSPGVTYAPTRDLSFHLGGEFSGGEYQLHEAALGAQVVRYRDFRVVGNTEFTIIARLKGELAAGYAFDREFVFYDVFDATRHDIKVDAGPFVRAGLKMHW
jgi:hypothetical protein